VTGLTLDPEVLEVLRVRHLKFRGIGFMVALYALDSEVLVMQSMIKSNFAGG
jgi:hypothetical protein